MLCSNCGTQIPDDASFCSKCGSPQRGMSDAKPETIRVISTDRPPVFIGFVGIEFFGPIKDKSGKDKFGFDFSFSLRDADNKQTRADGRADLEVYTMSLFGKPLRFSFHFCKDDFTEGMYEFKRIEPLLNSGEYGGKINIVTLDGARLSKTSAPRPTYWDSK